MSIETKVDHCPGCGGTCFSRGIGRDTIWVCRQCGKVTTLNDSGDVVILESRRPDKNTDHHCPRCGRTCFSRGIRERGTVWECRQCGKVALDENGNVAILGAWRPDDKPAWMRAFDVVALVVILLLIGCLAIIMGELLSGLEGYILGVVAGTLTMAATGWKYRP